jgi:hypothetical protein
MRGQRRRVMVCALLAVSAMATAAEQWHTSTIKYVYPQSTGQFVVIFDTDAPGCTATGPGKYMLIYDGSNGVTLEGRKAMYAAALMAVVTRVSVSIAYDDATSNCYINRLTVAGS